ncbi:MAG: hypothetical protein PWQ24_1744, partial [Mesotoga sp.]|nr:hypothetical protein [Mesotoga sp.]
MSLPAGRPDNKERMASTIEVAGWFSAKARTAGGIDASGNLLDQNGEITVDTRNVACYRLTIEAKWEFAAREGFRRTWLGGSKEQRNWLTVESFSVHRGEPVARSRARICSSFLVEIVSS